jgi:hypothetical protein
MSSFASDFKIEVNQVGDNLYDITECQGDSCTSLSNVPLNTCVSAAFTSYMLTLSVCAGGAGSVAGTDAVISTSFLTSSQSVSCTAPHIFTSYRNFGTLDTCSSLKFFHAPPNNAFRLSRGSNGDYKLAYCQDNACVNCSSLQQQYTPNTCYTPTGGLFPSQLSTYNDLTQCTVSSPSASASSGITGSGAGSDMGLIIGVLVGIVAVAVIALAVYKRIRIQKNRNTVHPARFSGDLQNPLEIVDLGV